jgi:hypothetical protein
MERIQPMMTHFMVCEAIKKTQGLSDNLLNLENEQLLKIRSHFRDKPNINHLI